MKTFVWSSSSYVGVHFSLIHAPPTSSPQTKQCNSISIRVDDAQGHLRSSWRSARTPNDIFLRARESTFFSSRVLLFEPRVG